MRYRCSAVAGLSLGLAGASRFGPWVMVTGPFFGRLRRDCGFAAGLSLLLAKRMVLVVGVMPTTPFQGWVLDGPARDEAAISHTAASRPT